MCRHLILHQSRLHKLRTNEWSSGRVRCNLRIEIYNPYLERFAVLLDMEQNGPIEGENDEDKDT